MRGPRNTVLCLFSITILLYEDDYRRLACIVLESSQGVGVPVLLFCFMRNLDGGASLAYRSSAFCSLDPLLE